MQNSKKKLVFILIVSRLLHHLCVRAEKRYYGNNLIITFMRNTHFPFNITILEIW
jgi:hypothetical protein